MITALQLFNRAKERHNLQISKKSFMLVYRAFFNRAIQHLVEGKHFSTGYIGSLYIGAVRKKPKMIDWGTTTKMWKEHPELREQKQLAYYIDDMPIYTFVWARSGIVNFPAKRMYRFRMSNIWRWRLRDAVTKEQREYQ